MSSRPNTVLCSITGCDRQRRKRGWCQKHYARWRATGDPLKVKPSRPGLPAAVRLFQRIKLDPVTGCWLWQLKPTTHGYGSFVNDEGHRERVHRFAYRLMVGPIREGAVVDHDCHNRDKSCPGGPTCAHRLCCNPLHLTLTTLGENVLLGVGPSAVNARKTHCKNGHPLSGDNLMVVTKGRGRVGRQCRVCRSAFRREWRRRQREKAGADRQM